MARTGERGHEGVAAVLHPALRGVRHDHGLSERRAELEQLHLWPQGGKAAAARVISTRILGSPTASFHLSLFLTAYRMALPQDPSTDAAPERYGYGQYRAFGRCSEVRPIMIAVWVALDHDFLLAKHALLACTNTHV